MIVPDTPKVPSLMIRRTLAVGIWERSSPIRGEIMFIVEICEAGMEDRCCFVILQSSVGPTTTSHSEVRIYNLARWKVERPTTHSRVPAVYPYLSNVGARRKVQSRVKFRAIVRQRRQVEARMVGIRGIVQ